MICRIYVRLTHCCNKSKMAINSFDYFPPLYPTYPPKRVRDWNAKLSTAHAMQNQMTGFSAQDTQSEGNAQLHTHTHTLRQAYGSSVHTDQTVLFHTGQQWLTSTDEGFWKHTWQCSGVSPQSNIAAGSNYFYMHTILRQTSYDSIIHIYTASLVMVSTCESGGCPPS